MVTRKGKKILNGPAILREKKESECFLKSPNFGFKCLVPVNGLPLWLRG